MKTTATLCLFHSAADVLSNWHPSPFTYKGFQFNCVEQFMMFSKAKMFGDEETAKKVMETHDPRKQKALGREVQNYDDTSWAAKRLSIVTVGCREKFMQNPALLKALLDTEDTVLVEASPYDRVWGIGLGEDGPRSLDPANWQGSNLLGEVLMVVRKRLTPAPKADPACRSSI